MRLIIEFDGPIVDILPVLYCAHREAAAAVDWSRLDEATFRRLTRTKGTDADYLPGSKPLKASQYQTIFAEMIESDESLRDIAPQPGTVEWLQTLGTFGKCCLVTLGSNIESRRMVVETHGLGTLIECFESLAADARRRPTELRALTEGDERTLVVAATDVLIRSADAADLFTVAVACGSCTAARLHRAGARVVYKEMDELISSLRSGARDLIDAGMLPLPLG